MGRGRGKFKKQTAIATSEDLVSGAEEKAVPYRRRGRPLKLSKKETKEEEDDTKIIEEEEGIENEVKGQVVEENGRKRKRSSQIEESEDSVKEEYGEEKSGVTDDSVKFVGFRQSGSRRKSKPRRAAQVGVECF